MKVVAMGAALGVTVVAAPQPANTQARNAQKPKRSGSYIETDDGTKLFYRDWGAGTPIVFCHPWALNSDIWEYQMVALSEQGVRCIAYDRRGHGRSDDPGGGYDYDTLASDLATVIERLDLHHATLVGYSMGSGEIIHYVSCHGADRVARVVLTSPVPPGPGSRTVSDGIIAELKKDRPAYMATGLPLFIGRQPLVSAAMSQWILEQFLRASPKGIIECMRNIAAADHRPHLSAMKMPTLIIQGDHDEVSPLDLTGRRLAEAIADSKLKIYEGAPHGIVLTHRDQFTSDLLSFLRG
jgi:non-heme chloroperoxidase